MIKMTQKNFIVVYGSEDLFSRTKAAGLNRSEICRRALESELEKVIGDKPAKTAADITSCGVDKHGSERTTT